MSPANSFGFMDGGVDMLFSRHFGRHAQDRLLKKISTEGHFNLQWLIEDIQI
jgi:O-acetyl-ADP-ribose deacetylase (regulator of RNase III)